MRPQHIEVADCMQVYGAATMNNTLCLGLFLLIMHIRDLPWRYSSEVITTVGAPLLACPPPLQVNQVPSEQFNSGPWALCPENPVLYTSQLSNGEPALASPACRTLGQLTSGQLLRISQPLRPLAKSATFSISVSAAGASMPTPLCLCACSCHFPGGRPGILQDDLCHLLGHPSASNLPGVHSHGVGFGQGRPQVEITEVACTLLPSSGTLPERARGFLGGRAGSSPALITISRMLWLCLGLGQGWSRRKGCRQTGSTSAAPPFLQNSPRTGGPS